MPPERVVDERRELEAAEPSTPSRSADVPAALLLAQQVGNNAFSRGIGGDRGTLARQTIPFTETKPKPNPADDPNTIWLGGRPAWAGQGGDQRPEFELGVKPDPKDPYELPPTNWDELTGPTGGPEVPQPWAGATPVPKAPLPWLGTDDKPTHSLSPNQVTQAQGAVHAFEDSLLTANTSWNSAIPLLSEYTNATAALGPQGTLGKEGGVHWNQSTTPNANMTQLAGDQKVGPNDETTVNKLFDKDNKTGVDPAGLHGNKETAGAMDAVRAAGNALATANKEHALAQMTMKGAASAVRSATLAVTINEKTVEADKLEDEKHRLQEAKESALKTLEQIGAAVEGGTLVGWGIIEAAGTGHIAEGAESIMIGAEMWADALVKAEICEKYDPQIEKADADIRAAVAGIRSMQGEAVQAQLDAALTNQQVAMARIHTTRADVITKMAAYQQAHNAMAKAASGAAGGGAQGAQVFAAIEAIPKVKIALASVAQINGVLKVPSYNEASGRGFNACGRPPDFVAHLGQLKGYKGRFADETKLWNDRLTRLQAIADRFDRPAGQ